VRDCHLHSKGADRAFFSNAKKNRAIARAAFAKQ